MYPYPFSNAGRFWNIVNWDQLLPYPLNPKRNPDCLVAYRCRAVTGMLDKIVQHPYGQVVLQHYLKNQKNRVKLPQLIEHVTNEFTQDYRHPVCRSTEAALNARMMPKLMVVCFQLLLVAWFTPAQFDDFDSYLSEGTYPNANTMDVDIHSQHYFETVLILAVVAALEAVIVIMKTTPPWAITDWDGWNRGGSRRVELFVWSNLFKNAIQALNMFGPEPTFDRDANHLLARGME